VTKFFLLSFLFIFLSTNLSAQNAADSDSVKKIAPVLKEEVPAKDTVMIKIIPKKEVLKIERDSATSIKTDTAIYVKKKNMAMPSQVFLFKNTLLQNAYFNFYGKIKVQDTQVHKVPPTDGLFYLILILCFYFAFIRLFFGRYLNNIFSLFFRASMRHQQIREQALQAPFPSLLLNILFDLSSALYASFFIRYYKLAEQIDFWLLYIYCLLAMLSIYLAKFALLKICGWIFNISRAADNYIFIVFLVNKVLGIGLLPFLALIAFSDPISVDIAITVSIVLIIILFLYRFIACFGTIRAEIKINVFHYFLYLCAFEIAPLLLIYKVVLSFLKKAY
jgi:hypothetical protein